MSAPQSAPLQAIADRLYALSHRIDRFDGEYASTEPLRDECAAIASDLLRLTLRENAPLLAVASAPTKSKE